jgi:hypothetical protein
MYDKKIECFYEHFEFDIRFNRIRKKKTTSVKSSDNRFEK